MLLTTSYVIGWHFNSRNENSNCASMAWRELYVRPWQLALCLLRSAGLERIMRIHFDSEAGPGRYCSPRHRKSFNSRNEGSKCVSTTWR